MVKIYRNGSPFALKCMRISTLLIGIQIMTASLLMARASKAQSVNLDVKLIPVVQLLKLIEQQTTVTFAYNDKALQNLPNVSLKANNQELPKILNAIEKQVPLRFLQNGNLIGVVRTENKNDAVPSGKAEKPKPQPVKGKVFDEKGQPLPGVTIRVKKTGLVTYTNENGDFQFKNLPDSTTLVFSFIGYLPKEVLVTGATTNLNISLQPDIKSLQEVNVSTGYQDIPKERATGSFVVLDSTLLNRRVSTNILDRIDGITPGLYNNGLSFLAGIVTNPSSRNTGLIIRGVSTFESSKEPLIVVDNFPYEGEISNINPNDVENITVLKDAAAASIWGARSGNGVIVITTKKGRLNQKMKVEFNSNVTIVDKPNLFYAKNFLDPSSYVDLEQYLFKQGFYDNILNDNVYNPAVTPAVNILVQQRAGTLSEAQANAELNALKLHDVRNDYSKYVYEKGLNQQYSLNIRGGTDKSTYQLSVGQDENKSTLVRNGYSRTTINSTNSFMPIKNLLLTAGINYSQNTTKLNNSVGFGTFSGNGYPYGNIYPYAQLADANGNPLNISYLYNDVYINSLKSKGFLDWSYSPLNELNLADNAIKINDIVLKVGAQYKIIPQLSIQLNYQNERQVIQGRTYQDQNTFYTRNLINKFAAYSSTTGSTTFNFPLGAILDLSNTNWYSNNLRTQLNYVASFAKHSITAIAGAEIRELKTESYSRDSYGYNEDNGTAVTNLNFGQFYPINPAGSAYIPGTGGQVTGTLNRYISYYSNAGYTYNDKYTLSLSGRIDGANLYGAKTNDKIAPLWSTGFGWEFSKEAFYNVKWLPFVKLRGSYGFNGNTNQTAVAYVIATYINDSSSGAAALTKLTAPNPELRWEKIKNINIGFDFATKGNFLSGTFEWFQKNGEDLIQSTSLAPQTGFTTYKANTANTLTRGTDITLQSQNLRGKLKWSTTFLFSSIAGKVVKYDAVRTRNSITGLGGVAGKPLEGIFSYRWAGLDPANGDPQGYLNGKVSKDYTAIINNFNPDSLVYSGSVVPTLYGGFRNDFSFKGISLSVNIVYRLGYVFRKSTTSLNYADVLLYSQNEDYTRRWKTPGDEVKTNVPSLTYVTNSDRNMFYQYSTTLVQPGDHIRLQDVRLGYDLPRIFAEKIHASKINIYAYANNIGIIWRKNKVGIDPEAAGNGLIAYPNPFTMSFGLNINL